MKTARIISALASLLAILAVPARAQWLQNSNTGSYNYTATSNWNGGVINNQFVTNITTGVTITFASNYTLTSQMLLGWGNNANVTFASASTATNTISFGSGGGIAVTNAVGGTITLGTTAAPLIFNLNGNSNCTIGGVTGSSGSGNVTMNVNAQITDSSGGTNGLKVSGDRVFTYLLNTNNNFTGPVNFFSLRGGGFANIKPVGGGPSALGAPNDSTNGTVSVADDTSNGSLQYSGSGDTSDRPFNWAITFNSTYANGYQFENVGTGKLKLSGQWTLPSSTNATSFIVNAASNNIELDGYFKGSGGGTYVLFEGSGNSTNQVFLNGATNDFAGFEVTSGVLAYNTISNAGAQCSLGTNGTLIVRAGGSLQYLGTNASTTNGRTISLTCPPSGSATTWNLDNGNSNTLTLTTISLTNFANTTSSNGVTGAAGAHTLGLNVFTAADAGPYGTLVVPSTITDLSSSNSVLVVAGGATGFTVFNGGTVELLGQSNTFSGGVQIKYDRTLEALTLADSNTACSLGVATNPASGFTAITFGSTDSQRGGTLAYIGTNAVASCNRQMSVLGTTGSANNFSVLNNSPNNSSVHFSATGPIIYTTTNMSNCLITLGGTAAATNILDARITNAPAGNASLTVSGSTWALTASNSYAGGTTVSAGTLQVGNGTAAATLGTGPITNKSALVYFHTDTVTNGQTMSGIGSLTHNGSGTLALAASNSYSGGTVVNAGTLDVQHDNGLGSGNVTVASGATLKLDSGVNNTYIGATADLWLEPGSPSVNLAFTGAADSIYELSFDGGVTFKAAGTWGAPGSGAAHTNSVFSGTGILNVTNGPTTTTTVTSSVPSSTYGQSVSFTANVTPATATGTVQFIVDSVDFGSPVTLSGGSATSGATTALSAGSHSLSAVYSGDDNDGGSTGTNLQAVAPAPLTITANSTNKTYGQTVTFAGTEFTTGMLYNSDGVTSVTLTSGGTASNATAGPYSIVPSAAVGSGLANYSITYSNGTLTVNQASTTMAIATSGSPALPGSNATFTATLSITAPGAGTPSGGVQFLTNGIAAGSVVPFTNLMAQYSTTTLPHATNLVTALYAGDSNFIASSNSLSEIINTPPIAGTANYSRLAGTTLIIPVSSLLTNASDADGDAISLLSFSTNSTNGATISETSTNGTSLAYVPPATNGDVTDSFTYTVADTFGATNTGVVIITIATNNNQSVNITGVTTLPNGTALISFAGIPNYTYLIQATTNLTPTIVWTTIATNMAGTNGLFQYNDLDSTNYPTRYYRTTTP